MPSKNPDKPNIVFILTDDQGCWAMGCAGNGEIRTPNLDRLAAMGTRFDSFCCASPVCSPARASILTGRIPSQHGVHDWIRAGNAVEEYKRPTHRLIEYLKDQPAYTDVLAGSGYVCGLSGKWHLGDAHHAQKRNTFWKVHAQGGGPYYGAPVIDGDAVAYEPRYITDVITDWALEFLALQQEGDRPFHLGVHYTAPHSPWGRDQHPKELYDSYLNGCPFESTPNVPAHPWASANRTAAQDEASRRKTLSGYFAAVTAMDANVGRLLDALEQQRLLESTLIVFTSDNGMNMGHHGVWGKGNGTWPMNMYDTSVKVPMLIAQPGRVPQGAVCGALLSQYDLRPTLLACCGAEDPEAGHLPGVSFAALLQGRGGPPRENVVVFDEYGPVRMIRTESWKYVHRYPYGPHELYDLAGDPGEERNLIDAPEHAARIVALKGELEQWFVRYVDPARDGTHEGVTGSGQLDLAGPAGAGRAAWQPR
ncbi:MAG: sulfatase-like hydrolase/transferase [Kiritimatiellae bacterium]|nr:sulfatase-like hydrolase/transferase [Kiritimatiellia bacterium]